MLTHLQIRDFAIIDAHRARSARRPHRAHRRNRRGQIHRRRCAGAARRRQGRRRSRARGHRARRAVRHLRHQRKPDASCAKCSRSNPIEADDELTVRRVIANDGRSRGYLNGVSVPLQLLRDVGSTHRRYPRPARIPVADARQRAARAARRLRRQPRARRHRCARRTRVWIALVNRTVELEGKARDRDSRGRPARASRWASSRRSISRKAKSRSSPRNARAIPIAAGSPKPRRPPSACCTTPTKATRTPPRRAHSPASRRSRASISGSRKVMPMVDEATIQIREAARELSRYLETLDIDPARQERSRTPPRGGRGAQPQTSRAGRGARAAAPRQLEKELAELDSADNNLSALQEGSRPKRSRAIASSPRSCPPHAQTARARSVERHHRAHADPRHGGRPVPHRRQPADRRTGRAWLRRRRIPRHRQSRAAAAAARQGGVGRRARAPVARRAGRLLRARRRCMVFDEVDSGVGGAVAEIVGRELQGARILRPGDLRHPPAAGGQPGPPPSARRRSSRTARPRAPRSPSSPWTSAPRRSRAC